MSRSHVIPFFIPCPFIQRYDRVAGGASSTNANFATSQLLTSRRKRRRSHSTTATTTATTTGISQLSTATTTTDATAAIATAPTTTDSAATVPTAVAGGRSAELLVQSFFFERSLGLQRQRGRVQRQRQRQRHATQRLQAVQEVWILVLLVFRVQFDGF